MNATFYFRSRKAAAPLKLHDVGGREQMPFDFRSRKAAAPLKLANGQRRITRMPEISAVERLRLH